MDRRKITWALILLGLMALGTAVAVQPWHGPGEREMAASNGVVYLSDLRWEWATTGWVALADDHLPKLDTSFLNSPLAIGGRGYEKGIGTFPLSEIVYPLDGAYRLFQADVGVDDAASEGRGSVVFKVFLDDVPVFESGVVRAGDPPVAVEIPVSGAARIRLVAEDGGDGSAMDYADWADARLVPANGAATADPQLAAARAERQRERDADLASVEQRSERAIGDLASLLDLTTAQASAIFDEDHGRIVLANGRLALTLGYGGESHGLLHLIDLGSRRLVAIDTTASITMDSQGKLLLSSGTVAAEEGGYRFSRVNDPVLGAGVEAEADYLLPDSGQAIAVRIVLFDGSSYFTYQLEVRGEDHSATVRRFSYFDPEGDGWLLVGGDALYLTDYSLMRRSEIRDDSVIRKELVGLGKPLLLYSRALSRGVLAAVIDEVPDPSHFSLQVDPGRVVGRFGFDYAVPDDVRASRLQTSPRLFFQVTSGGGLQQASREYRRVMAGLYPQPPLPDWVKYQWGTWYVYYMNYDEEAIKSQVDYIADNLSDLGPWSILLDAGWYVAEGRPGSSWEQVDEEKFPSGLRALVDYAHSRGVKVVLYFSAPYLDDRDREGNWLGLRGFVEQHPEWLIRLQSDASGSSYVYDFTNPELVAYMRGLISSFFSLYDVDGIKIDGLGQAEGEELAAEERDSFGDVNKIRMFTMDIYRLVHEEAARSGKDAYIESGWAIPAFAVQYAHTFRYGDEFPEFEHRYPAGGLLEHIDYATLQKAVLGQRPNMGMVWGGAESQGMIRTWFEAALAMGTQMTMSTDLTRMSGRDLSALRSVLVHYNAFQGETRFVGMPFAQSFATAVGDIVYLGALNRDPVARDITLRLSDYGLDPQREYLMYDVSASRYSRVRGSFTVKAAASSFRLFLLTDKPGVIWTNSAFRVETAPRALKVQMSGPRAITGFVQIHVPSPTRVRLDGRDLPRLSTPGVGSGYSYDDRTGVLRLRYRHDWPHTLEVSY